MRYTTTLSNIRRLKQLKQRHFMLALISMLLNILLLLALLWQVGTNANKQRTLLVPPQIEESFWVSPQHYSNSYLRQMSLFFAQLRFNATPASAASQYDMLLRYVHPKAYATLKQQLSYEQATREQTQLSSVFYPVTIAIDPQTQSAQLSGDLWQMVDDEVLPITRRAYQITTRLEQGRLFITRFSEITDEEN